MVIALQEFTVQWGRQTPDLEASPSCCKEFREGINTALAGPERGKQEKGIKGHHILDLPLPVGNTQFSHIFYWGDKK